MSIDLQEQYDNIYRYCYYRLHNAWTAEDITQETFLHYLECDSYRDIGKPLAFLYTIARNLCIDEMRRKKTEELPEDLQYDGFENKLVDEVAVRQAVSSLEKEEQELLLLRFANEVPVADLAKFYGKSRYAVYRDINRITKKLEVKLRDEK